MFGNELTQLLTAMAVSIDQFASSDEGDKLAAGVAVLTKKLFDQFLACGFSREEAVKLTCASISKGSSSS